MFPTCHSTLSGVSPFQEAATITIAHFSWGYPLQKRFDIYGENIIVC